MAAVCSLLCGDIWPSQFNWSTLWVISWLKHIKFAVINSLLCVPMVNIDVWSLTCDVAHGAVFVCCCCRPAGTVCAGGGRGPSGQRHCSGLCSNTDLLVKCGCSSCAPLYTSDGEFSCCHIKQQNSYTKLNTETWKLCQICLGVSVMYLTDKDETFPLCWTKIK